MTAIISRILAIIMTIFSILSPAQPDNVKVTVKDMTTESVSISYTCVNNTGRRMDRPDILSLEKNVDGEWQEIELCYGRTEEYYFVNPGSSCTESADLGTLNENGDYVNLPLEVGEYRLTIGYLLADIFAGKRSGQSSVIFTVIEA